MPVAVPLAVMAAGAIANKVGQRSAAKKQNSLQDEINKRNIGVGDKALGFADKANSYIDGSRGAYQGLMGDVNSGKYDFNPTTQAPVMNESQDFYRGAMGNGLYSDSDKNDWRNRQALGNTATFDAVRRGLNENADIRGGGYSGYNNQLASLARDQSRQLEAGRLGAETQLQQNIRGNQFMGASGVQANSRDFTQQGRENADIMNQYGALNAGNRFTRGAGLLSAMDDSTRGYLGVAGQDLGIAGQNYRVQPPGEIQPWWGTLGAGAEQAAGAYLGAGGANKRVKPSGLGYPAMGA